LREQLAAAQSKEVCTVPHSDEVLEFCPYCKIERLQFELAEVMVAVDESHKAYDRLAETCTERGRELAQSRARYEYVRRLNVPQFKALFDMALHAPFDMLVDEAVRGNSP
jgi:hypothetical protein